MKLRQPTHRFTATRREHGQFRNAYFYLGEGGHVWEAGSYPVWLGSRLPLISSSKAYHLSQARIAN